MRSRQLHSNRSEGAITRTLNHLASGEISGAQLEGLSDLSNLELAEFSTEWRSIDPDRRYQIVRSVVETGEVDITKSFERVLCQVLSDPDPRIRRTAASGLWESSSPTIISSLIDLVESDEDESVVRQAITTLGLIAEHQVLTDELARRLGRVLICVVSSSRSAQIRREALAAVSLIRNDDEVTSIVRHVYDSGDETDQLFAIRAMGRLGVSNWRREISEAIKHPDDEVRAEAVTAIGASGNQQYSATVVQMAFEEEEDVQLAAIWALGELGGKVAVEALEQLAESDDPEVAEEALTALEQATLLEDFTAAPRIGQPGTSNGSSDLEV